MKKGLALLAFLSTFFLTIPAFAQDEVSDAVGGSFAIGILCCYGLVLLVGLALFVFWIFMLIDCIKRKDDQFPNASDNTKTIWLVILLVSWILGLNWLAAIVYYFMVKKKMPI